MLPRCEKPALVNARVREKKQVAALCAFHAQRAKEIGALIGWELILDKCMSGETCQVPIYEEMSVEPVKGGSGLGKVVTRLSRELTGGEILEQLVRARNFILEKEYTKAEEIFKYLTHNIKDQ